MERGETGRSATRGSGLHRRKNHAKSHRTMKLTIIQAGDVPAPLRPDFGAYPPMFMRMFGEVGFGFEYDTVPIHDGAPFPDIGGLEGIIITGSAAGVYDDYAWLAPLRRSGAVCRSAAALTGRASLAAQLRRPARRRRRLRARRAGVQCARLGRHDARAGGAPRAAPATAFLFPGKST